MTEVEQRLEALKALIAEADEAVSGQHTGQPDVRIRRPLWKQIVEAAR